MTVNKSREQRNNDTNTACAWAMAGGALLLFTPIAPLGAALIGQSIGTMATRVGVDAVENLHDRKYAE